MNKRYHFTSFLPIFTFLLFLVISIANVLIITMFPRDSLLGYIFMIIFGALCWLSSMLLFIMSLQTTKIDEKGIIQQNPLREVVILEWKNIKAIRIINILFKAIYISEFNYTDGEMLHLSPYKEANKLIRIRYSKKVLKEIQKFYNGKIE